MNNTRHQNFAAMTNFQNSDMRAEASDSGSTDPRTLLTKSIY
jgi:hypothetical protein